MTLLDEHRDALTWAAGRPGPPPDPDRLDLPRFVEDLGAHRLDARFLHRMHGSAVRDQQFDAVIGDVRRRHETTVVGLRQRIRTAELLAAQVEAANPDDHVIMLKGFTLYALSGDETAIRRSGDVDVITRDAAGLVRLAQAQGYENVGRPDILAAYADLRHHDLADVDVHSYYPMTALPAGQPGDPRTSSTAAFEVTKLRYEDLAPHTRRSRLPGLDRCRFLRPEAAALIHASHMHVEHLRVCPTPVATIRLDELATFVDLCRLPEFDPVLMADLIARFGAQDVVGFARALAVDLLGQDPFDRHPALRESADPTSRFFPRDLWWDGLAGLPVDLGWEPQEFVVREHDMPARLRQRGASCLTIGPAGDSAHFSLSVSGPVDLGAVATRSDGRTDYTLTGDLLWQDTALTVQVSSTAADLDEMTGLSLNFGDRHYELFYRPEIGALDVADYSNVVTGTDDVRTQVRTTEHQDVFTVRIPWDRLGRNASTTDPVALLLAARRQKREWGPVRSEIAVPMLLRKVG